MSLNIQCRYQKQYTVGAKHLFCSSIVEKFSTKSESEHENNSQHQSNKVT